MKDECGSLVGASRPMARLRALIARAAGSDAPVLIEGETGVGKELVASAIHASSRRASGPYAAVNCGAIPEELFESELFGHTRGAFTDAVDAKKGVLAVARGGTLVLDEIDSLSPRHQTKLLRVLETRQFKPVGADHFVQADFRPIATTNQPLEFLVDQGRFRADLFHRINVLRVAIPPLRERRDDVPRLARYFVDRFNRCHGTSFRAPSRQAMRALMLHTWPGNVRELENRIERTLVNSADPRIDERLLLLDLLASSRPLTKEDIVAALTEAAWNRARAAIVLGVSRATLWRKMVQCGITRVRRPPNLMSGGGRDS